MIAAAQATDLNTVHMHLHHALNCLVGPNGKGFDAKEMNPCAHAGNADNTIDDTSSMVELLNASGHGRCVITLDPAAKQPGQQPYQSIVPLSGVDGPLGSMAEVLEHYMHHSEQLDTRLWLREECDRARALQPRSIPWLRSRLRGAALGLPDNAPPV